jgi:hypothetical protein
VARDRTHVLEHVGTVVAVHRSGDHAFTKASEPSIRLVAGMGVEGDAHFGARVKHRSRVRADPEQPNLRQVHLLHRELFDEVGKSGFSVGPGGLGENITTEGLQLLRLPVGTVLRVGNDALIALTGLRNPCQQINGFASGLLDKLQERSDSGEIIRKAGVMGIVVRSGEVLPADEIRVSLPPEPHNELDRV